MSEENGKVCCNCRHNIRQPQEGNNARIECYCDLDNHYIGYVECMEHWCKHWAKEKEGRSRGMEIKVEDAIANLEYQILRFEDGTEPELALKMAIKALEQKQKSEWEHDHEILKAYSDGASDILDKIRAEVEQLKLHKAEFLTSDNKVCIDSQEVLDIIDKYKAESEVHCNCTTEEIAKSFIEDVEAVKDLLPMAESEVATKLQVSCKERSEEE